MKQAISKSGRTDLPRGPIFRPCSGQADVLCHRSRDPHRKESSMSRVPMVGDSGDRTEGRAAEALSVTERDLQDQPDWVTVGEVDLCYDAFGDRARPTLLLIMGLGFQLIHWPEDLCRQLAAEGFRVVGFDNRDAGRSTHLPGRRYTLEDMADDVVGLRDALGVESAHVVGASLGGMIAQMV